MQKLTREDLYSLEQYAEGRDDFRAKVLQHKRNRRIELGTNAALIFEDRLTMQYQIQEMLRIEKIFEAKERHLGNCQRIAHGHRSRIDIWQDGELSNQLMHDWARKWADIYVGTAQDCLPDEKRAENHLFRYKAQQGEFEISLPKTSCYIMPTDTTVELIADHIASTLKEQLPKSSIKVRAYEGIAKGAIVEKP